MQLTWRRPTRLRGVLLLQCVCVWRGVGGPCGCLLFLWSLPTRAGPQQPVLVASGRLESRMSGDGGATGASSQALVTTGTIGYSSLVPQYHEPLPCRRMLTERTSLSLLVYYY